LDHYQKVKKIYFEPLISLISEAHSILNQHFQKNEVQVCKLISFKTGGCSENCKYCSQSSYYKTETSAQPFLLQEEMLKKAADAKQQGATRVCIGAAWRQVRDGKAFDILLDTVKQIKEMGVEVCCTLGMLTREQAKKLAHAGLYAYNHNLDTSPSYYPQIVTTHTYQDRLNTLQRVADAGISLCCGGILGLGESDEDRIELLAVLSSLEPQPESVPINLLMPIKGTPLAQNKPVPIWDVLRVIATARILIPKAMIRLSAGRIDKSYEEQMLCFLAGANSIFSGEKLLTAPNPDIDRDDEMLNLFGLKKMKAYATKSIN
jgi:biotin synthase